MHSKDEQNRCLIYNKACTSVALSKYTEKIYN